MSSKRSKNKQSSHPPEQKSAPRRPDPDQVRALQAKTQAEKESTSSPNMLLGAVIVAAIFLGWYYHGMALRQMHDLVDLTMPDHHFFGYGTSTIETLRDAMNSDAKGQLNWVHKTAGMLFAIFTALATAVTVGMHGTKKAWRWVFYVVAIVFAVVQIVQNFLVDAMLQGSGDSLVSVSSAFTVTSSILLVVCMVTVVWTLVYAFIREFRRRWANPELQQGRSKNS